MKGSILIPDRVFFRISDVAEILGVKTYVIRFWESEFPFVAPEKSISGQRVYRRPQIESLLLVKHLLHVERFSIEGAKKQLTELRRTQSMKRATTAVIEGTFKMENRTERLAADQSATIKSDLKIGDHVPKEQIESLKTKITELQQMIRETDVFLVQATGASATEE